MNTKLNPEQIKQILNRSAEQIKPSTLERLRKARTQALAHFDARSASHALTPAFIKGAGQAAHSRHSSDSHPKHYYWAAAILLAAVIFSGVSYWHHAPEHDTSEVDIAILTDDLPMHVYVD
jgi:hypothetical protein